MKPPNPPGLLKNLPSVTSNSGLLRQQADITIYLESFNKVEDDNPVSEKQSEDALERPVLSNMRSARDRQGLSRRLIQPKLPYV